MLHQNPFLKIAIAALIGFLKLIFIDFSVVFWFSLIPLVMVNSLYVNTVQ